MISKDVWQSMTPAKKKDKIVECLQELYNIDHGLAQGEDQRANGRLCNVKRDLEQFIINTAAWEAGKEKI